MIKNEYQIKANHYDNEEASRSKGQIWEDEEIDVYTKSNAPSVRYSDPSSAAQNQSFARFDASNNSHAGINEESSIDKFDGDLSDKIESMQADEVNEDYEEWHNSLEVKDIFDNVHNGSEYAEKTN